MHIPWMSCYCALITKYWDLAQRHCYWLFLDMAGDAAVKAGHLLVRVLPIIFIFHKFIRLITNGIHSAAKYVCSLLEMSVYRKERDDNGIRQPCRQTTPHASVDDANNAVMQRSGKAGAGRQVERLSATVCHN